MKRESTSSTGFPCWLRGNPCSAPTVVVVLSVFTTANLGPPCYRLCGAQLQVSEDCRRQTNARHFLHEFLETPHIQNCKGVGSGELVGRGMGPAYAVVLPQNGYGVHDAPFRFCVMVYRCDPVAVASAGQPHRSVQRGGPMWASATMARESVGHLQGNRGCLYRTPADKL